jgi:hypothetical protein
VLLLQVLLLPQLLLQLQLLLLQLLLPLLPLLARQQQLDAARGRWRRASTSWGQVVAHRGGKTDLAI